MSRQVDLKDPESLSDEDLVYAAGRDMLPKPLDPELETRVKKLLGVPDLPLEERAHTGDVNSAGISKEEHATLLQQLAETQAENDRLKRAAVVKPQNIVGEYAEGWTNETRRNEMEKRGLDHEGMNKEALIEALQDDDRSKGAVDEEEGEDEGGE